MVTTRSLHPAQQFDGIVAGDDGVGRVVLHAKVGAVGHGVDDLQEDIHLLGKLRPAPVAILVVIFHRQHDIIFMRHGQQLRDRLQHPGHALRPAHLRVALPAEHATGRARPAQPPRHADHLRLVLERLLARVRVRVGEVGRAAEHGHGAAGGGNRLAHAVDVARRPGW
jgi:hypothetical protein